MRSNGMPASWTSPSAVSTGLVCNNIDLRAGVGTKGWKDAAPFDAILVAAGGPRVPESLKRQLAIGGRLVIPVGEDLPQNLLRVTRLAEDRFEEEDLGMVNFVPLVGEEGWIEDSSRSASNHVPGKVAKKACQTWWPMPPNRCRRSTKRGSDGFSTAGRTGESSCSAKRATLPAISTAPVRR